GQKEAEGGRLGRATTECHPRERADVNRTEQIFRGVPAPIIPFCSWSTHPDLAERREGLRGARPAPGGARRTAGRGGSEAKGEEMKPEYAELVNDYFSSQDRYDEFRAWVLAPRGRASLLRHYNTERFREFCERFDVRGEDEVWDFQKALFETLIARESLKII